jgi:hypothetical protein
MGTRDEAELTVEVGEGAAQTVIQSEIEQSSPTPENHLCRSSLHVHDGTYHTNPRRDVDLHVSKHSSSVI